MIKSLGFLLAGTLVFWAVVSYPARVLWGESSVLFAATAALLCLAPAAVTLVWSRWAFKGKPEQQLLAVMGGTGLRLLFVIGAGMAIYHLMPDFHYQRFWIFIIVFYLFTLALEMVLLTRATNVEQAQR